MPSNTTLDPGSGGDGVYTKQVTHDGDTVKLQGVSLVTVTGTEDAYTPVDINASNPLPIDVTSATIDLMLGTDFSSVFGSSSVIGAGTEAGAVRVTIATDSTGTLTVDNAGTFAVQIDGDALTSLQLIDDAVFTDDTSTHATGTTKVLGIGAVATPTDGSVGANDIGMPAMSTDRRLHVDAQIVGDALTALQLADNAIYVDDANWVDNASSHMLVGGLYQSTEQTITDGDVGPIQVDANGRVKVSIEVDNAGISGPSATDDAAFTAGTGTGTPLMGFATSDVVQSGDVGVVAMDTSRNLKVSIVKASDGLDVGSGNIGSETPRVAIATDDVNLASIKASMDLLDLTSYTDDANWVDGASRHLLVGGLYQSTEQTITDGDVGPFSIDANGRVKVSIEVDNAGIGGGTQYTEDAIAPADPVGTAVALVREDAPVSIAADGDIVAGRATQYGAQYVQIVDSSGNFVNSFGGSGGTSHTDDAAFTVGGASSITPTGFLADETTPDSVDEGDVGVPRMTLSRKPYAVITDATSENNAAVDGSGHLQVDIAADSVGIGGGTQYNEDDATPSPIVGTATLMERDDALSAVTPVEGDWLGLRGTAEGALWTQDFNSDSILTAVQLIDDAVFADDAAFTLTSSKTMVGGAVRDDTLGALSAAEGDVVPLRVGNTGALHTEVRHATASPINVQIGDGTNTASVSGGGALDVILSANSGVDIGDVDVASIAAGSNLVGDVGISGARTSGGTTLYKNIDVDESEDQIKGSGGQVYWIHAMNLASGVRYLKFYNATAASVTVGTTVPDMTFPIPTQGDTNGAGFTLSIPNGIAFGTAITIAATTGVADNNSGAPGANEVVVNLGYA